MFPNFKNLADRERKRLELLEKAQRRKRQATEKRQMYEGTQWATDGDKTLSTSQGKKTSDTNVNMTATEIEDAIKNADPTKDKVIVVNGTKKKPSGSDEGVIPAVVEQENAQAPYGTRENPIILGKYESSDSSELDVPSFSDFDVDGSSSDSSSSDSSSSDSSSSDSSARTIYEIDPRQYVKDMFSNNPWLVTIKMSPYDKTERPLDKLYLGKNAVVFKKEDNKRTRSIRIDWGKTAIIVDNIVKAGEERIAKMKALKQLYPRVPDTILERDYITFGNKNPDQPVGKPVSHINAFDKYSIATISGKKRQQDGIVEENPTKSSRSSFEGIDKYSDTFLDNAASKSKLRYLMQFVNAVAKRNDILLRPVLNVGNTLSDNQSRNNLVTLINGDIAVVGEQTNSRRTGVEKQVDWVETLRNYVNLTKVAGIDYGRVLVEEKKLGVKNQNMVNDDGVYRGTKIGVDEDTKFEISGMPRDDVDDRVKLYETDTNLTNSDIDSKKLLQDYYTKLLEKNISIPFKLHPVWNKGTHDDRALRNDYYMNKTYYFDNYFIKSTRQTAIFATMITDTSKPAYGNAAADVNNKTHWGATLEALIEGLNELYVQGKKREQCNAFIEVLEKNGLRTLNAKARNINPPEEATLTGKLHPLKEAEQKLKYAEQKVRVAEQLLEEAKDIVKVKPTSRSNS